MKIILPALFLSAVLSAQPSIQWQKTFGGSNGDQAHHIQQTRDGGFILAARTTSSNGDVIGNHGGLDFWVLKLDQVGIVLWKKTYGGSDNETPFAIRQTGDGGYVVVGHTLSNDGDISGNHGYYDAWVLKLDSTGTIQWQRTLGGSGWEVASAVQQTSDNGYIIAGRSTSTDGDVTVNHGSFDYWVVKLDSNGNILWQRSHGGSKEDIGYAVVETTDGGYIVTGESSSIDGDVSGNHGSSDYWVVKLSYDGKIEWEKSLGGSSIDRGNDILQSKDGGFVVFGQTYSNNGDVTGHHGYNDFWVVKLSESGSLLWQKALGGSNEDYASSIFQTDDNNYVMTGQTQSNNGDVLGNDGGADIWVVKLAEEGGIQWQKTLGGTQAEWGGSISQTIDDGFILTGYSASNNGDVSGNLGSDDVWVVKLSPESSSTSSPASYPLEIYPNPATHTISIKTPNEAHEIKVKISDLLGRELRQQTIPNGGDLEITAFPNGHYFLTAITPTGKVYSGKITKQE